MIPTPEDPTPLERFISNADKRARLYAILRDPVLEEAMAIAEDQMRPRSNTSADANHVLAVSKFQQSAGANEFIAKLKALTRESKPPVKLTERRLAKTLDDLPNTDPE